MRGESGRVRGYLDPEEEVRLRSRQHGVALVAPLARAFALAAAGGVLVVAGARSAWALGVVGALLLAAAAAFALAGVVRWDRTQLVLTTEKLFVVHGVARRRAAAVRLARVGAVEVEQSLLGRILGYGTLIAGDLEIPFVPDPAGVCRLVD